LQFYNSLHKLQGLGKAFEAVEQRFVNCDTYIIISNEERSRHDSRAKRYEFCLPQDNGATEVMQKPSLHGEQIK